MKLIIPAFKIFASMTLAGVCISLGAYAYLQNPGPIGAVLFSVGLMSVVHFKFLLYTGVLHKATGFFDFGILPVILIFNIVGCWISSQLVNDTSVVAQCEAIVSQRAGLGFWQATARGMGCGFIVTLAVQAWKKNPWALLIGVPAFILTGFTHSVADAFYYCVGKAAITPVAAVAYCGTVIGNFIGGRIYKLGEDKNRD